MQGVTKVMDIDTAVEDRALSQFQDGGATECSESCCGPRPWSYELPVDDDDCGPCFCRCHVPASDRGVRECPVCPPWTVGCFHSVDAEGSEALTIRLTDGNRMGCLSSIHPNNAYGVAGPAHTRRCSCGGEHNVMRWRDDARAYPTEAEARAEFERRCELMRQEAE